MNDEKSIIEPKIILQFHIVIDDVEFKCDIQQDTVDSRLLFFANNAVDNFEFFRNKCKEYLNKKQGVL